jgi:hypothetical protein
MANLSDAPHVKATARRTFTCNFCRAVVEEGEALRMPTTHNGSHRDAGCFCSTRCLTCVRALEALHPSPLASYDFRQARNVLTDRLLNLWRDGRGPDPALVLQAAERVSAQLR